MVLQDARIEGFLENKNRNKQGGRLLSGLPGPMAHNLLLYYCTLRGVSTKKVDHPEKQSANVFLSNASLEALEELFDLEMSDRSALPSLGRRIFIRVTEREQLELSIVKVGCDLNFPRLYFAFLPVRYSHFEN